jgi:hypothetical protein
MAHTLVEQFERLVEDGKLEEAKECLAQLAQAPASPEEQAETKILLTRLAVKLHNAAGEAYLAELKDAIAELKELNAKEKAFTDKVKLAEARAGLSS